MKKNIIKTVEGPFTIITICSLCLNIRVRLFFVRSFGDHVTSPFLINNIRTSVALFTLNHIFNTLSWNNNNVKKTFSTPVFLSYKQINTYEFNHSTVSEIPVNPKTVRKSTFLISPRKIPLKFPLLWKKNESLCKKVASWLVSPAESNSVYRHTMSLF